MLAKIDARLQAAKAYKLAFAARAKTEAELEFLKQDELDKRSVAHKAVNRAKKAYRKKLASRANQAFANNASSRMTSALMDKAAEIDKAPRPITELRMPGSQEAEAHTDIQGQTKCLRAHHEALGTPSPATTPHVAERRKWASDKVQELTATSERGPSSLNKTITIADVKFALNTMKNGKAAGHDGIAVELLKQSGPAGLQMLTAVYNEVLKTHTMPSEWRKGDVVSIFKSGDPTDPLTIEESRCCQ